MENKAVGKKEYLTRQRQAILEQLQGVTTHPSADVIYDMVRKQLPKISMGTVYRNLEQMAREGLILKLDGGTQKRYDGNALTHSHFHCLSCDEMIDLPIKPQDDIERIIVSLKRFEVQSYRLEFTGLCPKCKRAKKDKKA